MQKLNLSFLQEFFTLEIDGYNGGLGGDSFAYHNGMKFTTKDNDNDKWGGGSCTKHKGAWWYNHCHKSNLNGFNYNRKGSVNANGITYFDWRGHEHSLKSVRMSIGPSATDCSEVMTNEGSFYTPGVKSILINGQENKIYCDEKGWTVIQSRGQFGNDQGYFYRNWEAYIAPFGTPGEEHWLGLENISLMTSKKSYGLRIVAEDQDGNVDEATWSSFRVRDKVIFIAIKVGICTG